MRVRRQLRLRSPSLAGRPGVAAYLLSLAVALSGCASGASDVQGGGTGLRSIPVGALGGGYAGSSTVDVRNEASSSAFPVPMAMTAVWSAMPAVFERLGIEATYVDARQGQIGNPRYTRTRIERRALSTYIECGSGLTGPIADAYDVRLSLLVYLMPGSDGGTVVRTTMDAYATARSTSATSIHCTSKGVLERRIVALIQEGSAE